MRVRLLVLTLIALSTQRAAAATIGVPENVAPWGLSANLPEGQRGIYADLADQVAKRSKTPIVVRFVPYGRMLEGVRTGEFDVVFGVVGPSTEAAAPFTSMIAKVPMMAVARKGLSLHRVADLHGFAEVGYLRGGSCGALVDSDPSIHRVSQDSYELAIRKLAKGRLDAWCSIKAGFVYNLRKMGMADQLGEQLDYGEVKIGMQVTPSKLNTPVMHDVQAIVADLVKDGTVGQIFSRYIGATYSP